MWRQPFVPYTNTNNTATSIVINHIALNINAAAPYKLFSILNEKKRQLHSVTPIKR